MAYIEKIEDTWVLQGNYVYKVIVNTELMDYEVSLLNDMYQQYNLTCMTLQDFIPKIHCSNIVFNLKSIILKLDYSQKFIKSFFGKKIAKRTWKFWEDMGPEDDRRISENFARVKENERILNTKIEIQSSGLNKMYDFVNNSVETLNNQTRNLVKNFNILRKEMEVGFKFTNNIKRIVYWEAVLSELNYWIITMTTAMKYKQQTIINMLLNNNVDPQIALDVLGMDLFNEKMNETKLKIPDNLMFPKQSDGTIDPRVFNLIKYECYLNNSVDFMIIFKIPLVRKETFLTKRISFAPGINNTIMSIIELEEDLILHTHDSTWGYVWKFNEFINCFKLRDARLCDIHSGKINLETSEKCVTHLIYRNKTNACKVHYTKINQDIWFSTSEHNVWRYVTPKVTTVKMSYGVNETLINITDSGEIKIIRNMSISTENLMLEYFEEDIISKEIIKYEAAIENNKFLLENWVIDSIPILNVSEKVYSVLDHKKIFNLSVDLDYLNNHKIQLKEMEYKPYTPSSTTWWFSHSILVIPMVIITLFFCFFKGEISFCTKKLTIKRNIEEFEMQEIKTIDQNFTEIDGTENKIC